jgi:hypothetical protein
MRATTDMRRITGYCLVFAGVLAGRNGGLTGQTDDRDPVGRQGRRLAVRRCRRQDLCAQNLGQGSVHAQEGQVTEGDIGRNPVKIKEADTQRLNYENCSTVWSLPANRLKR